MTAQQPLFRDIDADDEEPENMNIQSLCMNCHEQAETKLLLTKIPHFREVIISSSTCQHCGERNSEIEPAQEIQELGVKLELKCRKEDLNRQIVRQKSASYRIPELDFESQGYNAKGVLTTVEGLLLNAIQGLEQQQPVRKIMDPETAQKIDEIISRLEKLRSGEETPFTLILDDPSGNSFIENPSAPAGDTQLSTTHYHRTAEQNENLGIEEDVASCDAVLDSRGADTLERKADYFTSIDVLDTDTEVMEIPANCPNCQAPILARMKVINIPYFKEAIIMANSCDACGTKSNEVKAGGGIEDHGTRIKLQMTHISDLSRDVLKGEHCSFSIPEFGLQLSYSSMGGRFTTLEGLLVNIKEDMGRMMPFQSGDSADREGALTMKTLKENLDKVIAGEKFVVIELDDPLGNSYVQNLYAPDEDPELSVENYERSPAQNDELGISDMRTENY